MDLIIPFIREHQAATSILVYAEVIEYLKGLPDFARRRHQLHILLREIYPYFLTYAIVERYADIRRALRSPHGPGLIGDVDTLIAATALECNLTVVTLDQDFRASLACGCNSWRCRGPAGNLLRFTAFLIVVLLSCLRSFSSPLYVPVCPREAAYCGSP